MTHAFRKFFNTECAKSGIYPDYIELMLGHKLPGVRSSYQIPDIQTLLEGTREVKGYVAAIDALTINEENRLQKQVQELKQQDDYSKFIIDKKMKEKDEEILKLKQQMKNVFDQIEMFKSDLINNKNHPARIKFKEIIKTEIDKIQKPKIERHKKMVALLDEIERKRKEILLKKGFITKEDEETIDKSILEEVKQNYPHLLKTVFKQ